MTKESIHKLVVQRQSDNVPYKKICKEVCKKIGHSRLVAVELGLVQCLRCKEVYLDLLDSNDSFLFKVKVRKGRGPLSDIKEGVLKARQIHDSGRLSWKDKVMVDA